MVINTTTVLATVTKDGALYVARPGYHLPEPQVTKLRYTSTYFRTNFQDPDDLHIYMNNIKDDKFHLSLYVNQNHPYNFQTPDCSFLKLHLVTPYTVDCSDLKNLTMCTR